jgi:5-methylcytosine-specific restriction endonuclease McrA
MEKVLVLNNDYTPLNVTTLKRGFKLVYKGKAEIIFSDDNNPIVSTVKTFRRPTIIRLIRYIFLPYKKVPLSRYNIFRRDEHKCVYCGTSKNLTLDHVLPKSRGGENTWKNLVTCCGECNLNKGDKTPEESNMIMLRKPYTPTYIEFVERMNGKINEEWKPYLLI